MRSVRSLWDAAWQCWRKARLTKINWLALIIKDQQSTNLVSTSRMVHDDAHKSSSINLTTSLGFYICENATVTRGSSISPDFSLIHGFNVPKVFVAGDNPLEYVCKKIFEISNEKTININKPSLSCWWFQPLCKILVSWDHYSQFMEK